jgi:hypothetical protein
MGSLSPIAIALSIIILLTLVGLILAHFRDRGTFAGYEEIASEARQVSRTLKGELFRDGSDLVVSGNYLGLPTVVRFSYAENTPGMNIRMSAPATFTLSVVPKGAQATEGRVLVRTSDDMFDAKFTSRSDHPNQAKIFLGGKTVGAALKKLCCSQKTFFTMTTGSIELSELVIPEPYTAHHITDHIESMRRLATSAAEMPGAHTVTIKKIQKERAIAGRIAIAVGVVAAIIVVVGATRELSSSAKAGPVDAGSATVAQGILPVDAVLISRPDDFRAATLDDLDPAGLSWLRQSGDAQAGRIIGNYSGQGSPRDVAYLLVKPDGTRRVVLLAGGNNIFDSEYKTLGFIARIPKERIAGVPWANPKFSAAPDGDGLLVVRNAQDPASGQLMFLSSGSLMSGNPKNYQQVSLE